MSDFGNKGPGPALKATLVSAMPAGHYIRRRTGALVTDSSGDVFIAHRGCDAGRASRVLPARLREGPSVPKYLATPIDEMNYIDLCRYWLKYSTFHLNVHLHPPFHRICCFSCHGHLVRNRLARNHPQEQVNLNQLCSLLVW